MRTNRSIRLSIGAFIATACATATLAPVVRGFGWLVPVGVVLALVTLVGLGVRQLSSSWVAVLAAQIVAVVFALNAMFTRGEAFLGLIPTPSSLTAWRQLAADGSRLIAEAAPPVEASNGLLFLLTVGIAAVAIVVDLIAVGLERPAVTGLPLLAIYCIPAAVLPRGLAWPYFLIAATGYLLLIAIDQSDRMRSWGQVLGLRTRPREVQTADLWNRLSVSGPLSGGRRLAVVTLAAAVAIPIFTPGIQEQALNADRGDGEGSGKHEISVVNPILTLRQNLTAPTDTVVIDYVTNDPEPPGPLRIATDDVFTGERWEPTTGRLNRKQKVQDGLPTPPGLAKSTPATEYSTQISVGNLAETYLPLPYPTTKVQIEGNWLWEANSLNVVGDGNNSANTTYVANYLGVDIDAARLSQAAPAPASVVQKFTALPETLPLTVATQAADVAGTGTPYEQALRLQEWLRSTGGFVYDLKVTGSDDSGQDAVQSFLTSKRGYCVQFASAMAVMARTLKIPSRVAVGFLPGERQPDGSYKVSVRDAHAWPEIYFEGTGWVRFEPTPSSRAPEVPAYARPQDAPAQQPSASASASARPSTSAAPATRSPAARPTTEATPTTSAQNSSSRLPWQLLLIPAVLALLALLALLPMAAATRRRRTRWNNLPAGRAAEAGWDDLRQRLGDLGVRWLSAWTPRAAQLRLMQDYSLTGEPAEALGRLSHGVEDAWYAPPTSVAPRSAAQIKSDSDAVVAALATHVEPGARRRAKWFPRSGVDILTGAERRRRADEEFLAALSRSQHDAPVRAGESRETVTTGARSRRSSSAKR